MTDDVMRASDDSDVAPCSAISIDFENSDDITVGGGNTTDSGPLTCGLD